MADRAPGAPNGGSRRGPRFQSIDKIAQFDSSGNKVVKAWFLEDGAAVNFDSLPGLAPWAPLFRYREPFRRSLILTIAANASSAAKRPLSQIEADVVGFHAATAARRMTYKGPTCVAAAAYATYLRRDTFRFPFYQPKFTKFEPLSFPVQNLAILRGRAAVAAWHTLRFIAYGSLIRLATSMFFLSFTASSTMSNIMLDPRLTQLKEDYMTESKKVRSGQRPTPFPSDFPTGRQAPAGRTTERGFEGDTASSAGGYESTYSSFGHSETSGSSATGNWTSVSEPPQQGFRRAQMQNQSAGRTDEADRFQSPDDDIDGSDGVSSIPPAAQNAERPASSLQSAGTTSWDKLRRQARDNSNQQSPSSWHQRRQSAKSGDDSQRGDPFAYSQSDEDKAHAKAQAQKEFDEMLEKERRGDSAGPGGRAG